MKKVIYNGNYINIPDELEPGYKELDLFSTEELKSDIKVNDSGEKDINLENTIKIDVNSLEDTQEVYIGEDNE